MDSSSQPAPAFSLRPAAPPDENFLLRLYAATRAAELARTGMDAAQTQAFIRQQFQSRHRHYEAAFPAASHEVILVNHQEAGVAVVSRSPREIRLVNIELLPAFQGRGIGSAFISKLCQESAEAALPLRLSVHKTNTAARRLYQRLGFREETTRDDTHLSLRWKPVVISRRAPPHG